MGNTFLCFIKGSASRILLWHHKQSPASISDTQCMTFEWGVHSGNPHHVTDSEYFKDVFSFSYLSMRISVCGEMQCPYGPRGDIKEVVNLLIWVLETKLRFSACWVP